MRSYAMLVAAAVFLANSPSAIAAETPTTKMIGSWIVSSKTDPFTDKGQDIALMPDTGGDWVIGLRCLNKEPSMIVMATPRGEDSFVRSVVYKAKLRADHGEIQDIFAMSMSDKGVEILLTPETFKEIEKAKTFALRLSTEKSDSNIDMQFEAKSTTNALDRVGSACSLH